MRINHKKKELKLSVRDLVFFGIPKHSPSFQLRFKNAEFGQKVHKDIQTQKKAENIDYQTEFYVKHQLKVKDWKVILRGRIDLLLKDSNSIKIEEIKSTYLKHFNGSSDDPRITPFILQLRCYAWILKKIQRKISQIFLQLILINRYDSTSHKIEVLDLDVSQYIHERITLIIDDEENKQSRYEQKVASLKNIHFPFPYRQYQEKIIEIINSVLDQEINIIIEAPSGLGKTVVSTYPLISRAIKNNTKLFFLTSKTTQRRIIEQTLELFREQGVEFLSVSLKAKEKMCTNMYYFCHEDYCSFLRNHMSKFPDEFIKNFVQQKGIILPERIEQEAIATEAFCPFELALDISLSADVIIGDYNYVFHPRVSLQRFFAEIIPKNQQYFLIIDEAHNLVERSMSYYSHNLSQKDVLNIKQAMKQLKRKIKNIPLPLFLPSALERIFRSLRSEHGIEVSTHLIDKIDISTFQKIFIQFEEDVMEYIRFLLDHDLRWPDDPIINFYYHLRDFVETLALTPNTEEFSILYNSQDGNIKILCKDASVFLRQRMNFFRSVIAISATITPFPFYRDLLGFPIDKTIYKRFSSPFSPERRKILIIPEIDTRYKHREHFYDDIAHLVQEILKLKEGRYFAFFPSFKYAEDVTKRFKSASDLLLLKQKNIMLDSDRRKFINKLKAHSNVLAIGVTAGIFAEGIDFPGVLDGIFIISPSLPPVSFERELLRQYYEERFSNGFAYAYQFPGLRRTFQAAGRLIRTANDRGIIIFIGHRFTTPYYAHYFPPDYYQDNPRELINSDPIGEIKQFWKKFKNDQYIKETKE